MLVDLGHWDGCKIQDVQGKATSCSEQHAMHYRADHHNLTFRLHTDAQAQNIIRATYSLQRA